LLVLCLVVMLMFQVDLLLSEGPFSLSFVSDAASSVLVEIVETVLADADAEPFQGAVLDQDEVPASLALLAHLAAASRRGCLVAAGL
jgi:hypothetical protein